jgi:hypothetical protein
MIETVLSRSLQAPAIDPPLSERSPTRESRRVSRSRRLSFTVWGNEFRGSNMALERGRACRSKRSRSSFKGRRARHTPLPDSVDAFSSILPARRVAPRIKGICGMNNHRSNPIHRWDRGRRYRTLNALLCRVRRLAIGAVLLGAALSMVMSVALSQELEGTPEQREACTPDAMKLCSDFIPDPDRVKGCLMQHVAALSLPCRGVFEKHRGLDPRSTSRSPRKSN